jgi:hypothetical protein
MTPIRFNHHRILSIIGCDMRNMSFIIATECLANELLDGILDAQRKGEAIQMHIKSIRYYDTAIFQDLAM